MALQVLLLILAISAHGTCQPGQSTQGTLTDKVKVTVNTSTAVHVTSDYFLSLGMDSNLIRNRWETFDFDSIRLRTLARGLSPAYLRLSGTDGDRLIFDPRDLPAGAQVSDRRGSPEIRSGDLKETEYIEGGARSVRGGSVYPSATGGDVPAPRGTLFPPTNFTMSGSDWVAVNRFAASVGWRVVFGLNAQLRRGADWDPSNAVLLLQHSIRHGFHSNLDFELGNEPDLYPLGKAFVDISPGQLARDFRQLRRLLDGQFGFYFHQAAIVGPDIAFAFNSLYLKEFLDHVGRDVIMAATFHQYYGGAELKYLANYTSPKVLDLYIPEMKAIRLAVSHSAIPDVKIWQGETSSTFAPPGTGICESYVAIFMLIDKLGLSARHGLDVVVRQTFYGFWFALVDENLTPRPTYWAALLFRNLVGTRVIDVTMTTSESVRLYDDIRVYAHCTSRRTTDYVTGGVTAYVINLSPRNRTLAFHGVGDRSVRYVLSASGPEGLMSASVSLNGSPIVMTSDARLPPLDGRGVLGDASPLLPAYSVTFLVFTDAVAPACL